MWGTTQKAIGFKRVIEKFSLIGMEERDKSERVEKQP
jgi:hypothetical protein